MLLVLLVHSFIHVALSVAEFVSLLFLPLSMAILESIDELSSVATPILPLVLAESFRFSFTVLAHEAVAIGKEVGSVTLP
jgi:putative effector of murein hydrolase LrgA (UPF0299 family)